MTVLLALWGVALADEVVVPTDAATLAEALEMADLLGDTIVLPSGVHTFPSAVPPVQNVTLSIQGAGPDTVLDGVVAVEDSALLLSGVTLDGLQLTLTDTDLTVADTVVVGQPLAMFGGSLDAQRVTFDDGLGASVLTGLVSMELTDVEVTSGAMVADAGSCTVQRVRACGQSNPSLDCDDGQLSDSLIRGSSPLALAGDVDVDTSTFVGLGLTLDGTVDIDRVLFVDADPAVAEGTALVSYQASTWWGGTPGDLVGQELDPVLPGDDCTYAGAVPGADVGSGFTASDDGDGDGDGSPFWEDCAPEDPLRYPGAAEVSGDGVDQDCDGFDLCYVDGDGDGYGDDEEDDDGNKLFEMPLPSCDVGGFAGRAGDCNDADPSVYEGAPELCDGLDNDCGGTPDDGLVVTKHCFDGDGDGYGTDVDVILLCASDGEYVAQCGDCADDDPDRHPFAPEISGNGIDEDCDGQDRIEVGAGDRDGDGYCDGTVGCTDAGKLPGDCNDLDAGIHPGVDEGLFCDGVDRNCDGLPYSGFDLDADGSPACSVCEGLVDVCDCNDQSAQASPTQLGDGCDGIDNDCDGEVDEDAVADDDGDGFTVPLVAGCILGPVDCDDSDPATYPGASEDPTATGADCDANCDGLCGIEDVLLDLDHDGYCPNGIVGDTPGLCDELTVQVYDCDDADPTAHWREEPIADLPDGADNDCDGDVDEDADALDEDGDGSYAFEDCNDLDPLVYPGAPERCNRYDDDCDGLLGPDEVDGDQDGWLRCNEVVLGVELPSDCDDEDPDRHPHQAEICGNGKDDDCLPLGAPDGDVDVDEDGDGWSSCAGDCNDADPTVRPGAPELCDLRDNDCDGTTDEGFDQDGDGAVPGDECAELVAFGVAPADCDESNPLRHEGLPERCDGIDNDCDELLDDDDPDTYADVDQDGVTECDGDCDDASATSHPYAEERCDFVDHDCDGDAFTEGDVEVFDQDGDGYRSCQGDCLPEDPTASPAGEDRCGVDGNCNGELNEHAPDLDGDGYDGCEDCAEGDPDISPGAYEVCEDGLDNDCVDGDATCPHTGVAVPTGDTAGEEPLPSEHTGDTAVGAAVVDLPPGWFCSSTGRAWSWMGWARRR